MLVVTAINGDNLVNIGQRGLEAVDRREYTQAQSSTLSMGLTDVATSQYVVL